MPDLTDADIETGLRLNAALETPQRATNAVLMNSACFWELAFHALGHYANALREVRRLREELARLRSNVTRCCFCGAACPDLPALKDHSCVCPSHPLRKGVVALEAECARLRALAARLVAALERGAQSTCHAHACKGECHLCEMTRALADARAAGLGEGS